METPRRRASRAAAKLGVWDRFFGWSKGTAARIKATATVCGMCGKPFGDGGLRKVFDHDHATNKFRGVIHDRCNRNLGFIGDSIESIEKILAYLRGQN
jgi:hypothetical protein